MDCKCVVGILWDEGVGPKALWLVIELWENVELLCKVGRCFGRIFKARHIVTQGGPLSPTIVRLMVDMVVRVWLINVTVSMDITNVCLLPMCF